MEERLHRNLVTVQANGLLSLEKTPAHLIETVRINAMQSPLLRLPREIRDKIYCFVLVSDQSIPIVQGRAPTHVSNNLKLLIVSRQLYDEASLLFFYGNIFKFQNLLSVPTLRFSYSLLKGQRNAIAKIQLVPLLDRPANSREWHAWLKYELVVPLAIIFPGLKTITVLQPDTPAGSLIRNEEPLVLSLNYFMKDRVYISQNKLERILRTRGGGHLDITFATS